MDEITRIAAHIADAARRLRKQPHAVTFHEDGWELEHSLDCRVIGMRHCQIHKHLKGLDGPPGDLGRYGVNLEEGQLQYFDVSEEDAARDLVAAVDVLEELL